MKNIYVTPTDKPSKVFELLGKLHLDSEIGFDHKRNRHIYITSDEEIKDGDVVKIPCSVCKGNRKSTNNFKWKYK